MEPAIVVAAIGTAPLLIAQALSWRDMRKRTNGSGPLSAQLTEMTAKQEEQHSANVERLSRIEDRTARIEGRLTDVEVQHLQDRKDDTTARLRIRTDLNNFNLDHFTHDQEK